MYNLTQFSLQDMTNCGAALRKLGAGAPNMIEVADRTVRYLYDHLVDPLSGERACVLVRFFKTHPYGELDAELAHYVRDKLRQTVPELRLKCLTLLATAGVRAEWNERQLSVSYKAWPLTGLDFGVQYPMFTQLFRQFGLDFDTVVQPDLTLLVDLIHKTFNVFHVAEAVDSPYIPAQSTFIIPMGIRSVLGFGGMLPTGNLFTIILFAKTPIPRETAEAFKTLALNVKMALLPFSESTIFSEPHARPAAATAPSAEQQPLDREITRLHAQIASLEQLLAVHEQAVLEQAERNAQLYAQSAVLAERHRLARDLHDSVTQSIYSTLLFADAGRLALQAEQPTVAAENLREARQMAGAALAEMRLLLYELHPPELVEEGLASALHTRLEAVESRTGLQVKVTVAGTLDLSPEQEGQLYKIAQEALNNVIKHAHATTVTVQLDGSDDTQFCLTIQDDGIGFAPKPDKPDAGLGLRSMRERAQQIGGDLTIRSARGEGTTVQVTVKNQKL